MKKYVFEYVDTSGITHIEEFITYDLREIELKHPVKRIIDIEVTDLHKKTAGSTRELFKQLSERSYTTEN